MNKIETLVAELRDAITNYRIAIAGFVVDEKNDFLRVVGQAEMIANALEVGAVDNSKLSIYAFSRQVSDSYYSQPSAFKALELKVSAIEKYIFEGL